MAYIRLPDNSYFKVPEDSTPEQAMQVAQQKYPKAFMSEKELESKQGLGAAMGEAFRGAKAASYEAAGKLLGVEGLKKASEEEYRKLREEPGFIPTTAEDREAAFKKGLFSGIGALGREYISEPVGGMIGRYGVPIAAGTLAAAAAPVTGVGALGAGIVGGAVTAAADYLPQVGENLERQREKGKEENLSDAALAGIPQAALSGLNLRLGMLPKGVQNIFKADAAALQKQVVSGALKPEEAISKLSGNLRNILLSTGSAAVVGTGTMVGEEMLRRGQAGQSLADAEAFGDYGDLAKDAAMIAPLFGVPRGALKRGAEKRGIEAAGVKRAEQEGLAQRAKEDADAAAAAELKQAEDFRAAQAKTGDLFGEPMRTEGPAKGKQAFGKMEGDVSPLPGVADNLTVAERERLAQEQGVETQTPFEAERQRMLLAKQVEELEVRVAKAAAQGDVNTVASLTAQVQPFRDALKKAEADAKAAGPIELFPAQQIEKMQSDLDRGLKELKKAGDLGDFDTINKLSPKLKDLQTKIAEAGKPGPDLFAVEEASKVKGRAEAQAALEQGQLDLMAQTRQPVPRVETKQKQILENYQDSVRQLDEAYAANADKRLVDQLVDRVIKAEAEKSAQIAKTSDDVSVDKLEASQQRVERIKRALAEATAKGDGPSIVGLRNQLAKAIVETARTPVDSRRSKALEDQMGAIESLRSSIEDLKSGRYLGEGTKDPATAASMRTGIERQANEAIGKYVEAAIRDVQALREQAGQKKMTVTEATRLAMDVRGHLENAVRNKNEAAFALPKGDLSLDRSQKLGTAPQKRTSGIEVVSKGSMSPIERQLAQIKKKYHKGEALVRKGPEGLKVEVDTLRSRLEKGETVEGGKPFETEARKEERLKEETAEAERVTRSGIDPDQRNLFGDKDLEPVATTRATPENFTRFLNSGTVAELRAKIKAKEDAAKAEAETAVKRAKDTSPVDQNYVAAFDRVEMLGKTAEGLQKSLDDALNAFTVARKKILGTTKNIKIELLSQYGSNSLLSYDTKSPGKAFRTARGDVTNTTKQLRALKETEAKLFRRLEELTAEPKTNQVKLDKLRKDLAQNRKEQAELTSSLQKKIKETRSLRKELKDALERSEEEIARGRAAQLAEFETLRKDLNPRIKGLLDEKLKLEKELNADAWSRMDDKVKAATSEAAKRQASAARERVKKRGDDQIEATQRAIKEQERRAADIEKQMSAERLADLPVVKQEVVVSEFNVENAAEAARKKDLKKLLATEKEKTNPDQKRIASLERQIGSIETRQPVLRKEITRENRTAAERREASLETQKDAQTEIKERRAPALERKSVAAAKAQESELNKQLKELRAKHGKMMAAKEKADSTVANARTERTKANAQAKLKNIQKDLKALQFEKRERVLTKQLQDLSSVGVKVERVLEVAGNRPGREQRTKPLRVGKTAAEKYDLNKDYAEAVRNEQIDDLKFTNNEDGTEVATFRGRSGTEFRVQAPVAGERVNAALAKQVSDAIEKNAPKDVNLKSVDTFAELPPAVKKLMERDGIVEGSTQSQTVRGFVTPDGDIYVIRGNHESVKDMERTYVHEIIGHAGVDRILGKDGMESLTKRVNAQGGAMELARKLGVDENVQGAMYDYSLAIAKMTRDGASKADIDKALKDTETQAVRELLAYTAEKRVDENFKQKAGRWVQEVIGAIRAALRKTGFVELSKVSTADIYNILRQSQKNYNKGELGAFRETNGNVAFRSKPIYNSSIPASEAATIDKVIARDKPFKDRIKSNTIGMSFMHRFVDRFAGLDYIARNMRDKLEGVQMMYYNRLYDQRNNMIAEIATHGSVKLEKNTDGTYQYKSRKGPSLKTVFESVNKAKSEFGNAQATLDYFGTYIAMERAASNNGGLKAGLEKLDLSGKISEAEANAILKKGRANTHFQEGRKAYREYNNGLLDLMVETGRLAERDFKAEARMKELEKADKKNTPEYAQMKRRAESAAFNLRKGDYVPYYRDRGGEIIDTENNIRVGNLKTQAYLKELVGGDSAIVNFETGALQNTYMLTDMAMANVAAKNTAYTMVKLGMAEVKPGGGPAKANIIRFYDNGVQMHVEINTRGNYLEMEARLDKMRDAGKANTPEYKKLRERAETSRASEGAFGDIPADLIVKGMEGVASAMPAAVSMMRGPANLLRKGVTRNPAYALRVAFKDSLSGWITSGADIKPIVSTLGSLAKNLKGGSDEVRNLQQQGIIGGHVFAGTMSDMRTIAQQIAQGQSGWEKLWAKADRMGIMADEAQRVTLYNGFIKKGLSPMEATLATLESQNFTKHGYSPSMKALSTMIPFFNAQIQGLNSFGRAISGTSLFQDKLGVREQLLKRGMMLAGVTMAYSALMQNNEAYQNATDIDKLNHWFIPLPILDEPLRVGIPFEAGLVFKALPEAIFNLMASDAKAKDVLPAFGRQVLNSIPGMSNLFLPQGVKPAIELATGTSFFTLEGIESARQKAELPGYRSGANTTEVSKAIGEAINVSPVQLDYAVNAYTSSLGLALLSMFNPFLRDASAPESKVSQMPIFGGFFQPTDGTGLINKAYQDMEEIEKVNRTYKNLEESNPEKAEAFLEKYLDRLDNVSAAGKFKKEMGDLNKNERMIRADAKMTASQKRADLDEIKQMKIELAKEFMSITRE